MSKKILDHSSVKRNYRFLAILLTAMVAGALLGWFKPTWGHNIAFLGKIFINMMFCIVVPMVFASISSACIYFLSASLYCSLRSASQPSLRSCWMCFALSA